MKRLLDTHIILWALDDNPKLSEQAKALIMDAGNDVYYCSTSVWETTIKYMSKLDKIQLSGSKLSELCRIWGTILNTGIKNAVKATNKDAQYDNIKHVFSI